MGHIPTGMAGAGTVGVLLARKKPAVWSISPDATVFEAIQLMADKTLVRSRSLITRDWLELSRSATTHGKLS